MISSQTMIKELMMARVGNSIIKGIEVQEIITTLNRAYADEWLAYYQYFIEAKVLNFRT